MSFLSFSFFALFTSTLAAASARAEHRPISPSPPLLAATVETGLAEFRQRHLQVGKVANPSGRISKVFYPFGGSDLRTAFETLSGPAGAPDQLMIVDRERFSGRRAVMRRFRDVSAKSRYFEERALTDFNDNYAPVGIGYNGGLWKGSRSEPIGTGGTVLLTPPRPSPFVRARESVRWHWSRLRRFCAPLLNARRK